MSSAEYIAPHVGLPTFFNSPAIGLGDVREGMAVVTGVPMDMGIVVARPGARYGPRAIREASHFYRGVSQIAAEGTSVDLDAGVGLRLRDEPSAYDAGDLTVFPQDLMKTTESVAEGVADIVRRGGFPVVLGGDHYVTYPSFEGFARGLLDRKPDLRLGHVHVDSHPDFRDSYGELGRFNHSTCVRRISENSSVSYANMAWVGINGNVLDAEMYRLYTTQKLKMVTAREVRERGVEDVVGEVMAIVADGVDAVYVSIDIDVVDASQSPGTGAPVFDGIAATDLLRAAELFGGHDVVGAVDLCEVSPPLDPSGRTAHLAASALIAFLRRHLYEEVRLTDL